MKHKEIASALATKTNYTPTQASNTLETLAMLINDALANAKQVIIPNIGLFQTVKKDECITVDAKTNERHLMPPKIEAVCIPAEPFVGQNIDSDEQEVIEPSILNIKDFGKLLAEKENISQEEAEIFIEIFSEAIPTLLNQEKTLTIKSFGSLMLTTQPSEESESPKQLLIFEPDSALSELVNKPFSHFEPVLLNEGVSFEHVDVQDETQPEEILEVKEEFIPKETSQNDDAPLTTTLISNISKQVKEIVESENQNDDCEKLECSEIHGNKPRNEDKIPTPPSPILTTPLPTKHHTEPFRNKQRKPKRRKNSMWIVVGTMAVAITAISFFFHPQNNED